MINVFIKDIDFLILWSQLKIFNKNSKFQIENSLKKNGHKKCPKKIFRNRGLKT